MPGGTPLTTEERIGLDQLTMTGVNPVDFVRTAAAAGARNISIWPSNAGFNPYSLPPFSLVEDAALRRDTARALADEGVSAALVDALVAMPDRPASDARPVMEACAELGARRYNVVSFDPDRGRTTATIAALAEMARDYDAVLAIEACPVLEIATLAEALAIVEAVGAPNLKLLIDTLHVTRTGEVGLLERIDPALIDYVQICDGTVAVESLDVYGRDAVMERGVPGEGELPLDAILACVPPHVIVSGEVPMHARRAAGMSDLDRSRRVVDAIRRQLDRPAQRSNGR